MKRDIVTREDVKLLVDGFYAKVQNDPLLGPVFGHVDWPNHLPVMYNFWSSMVVGDQSYTGNPLQKHLPLAIGAQHFDRWLKLFSETVDEHFSGERAQEIKMRARSIAGIFRMRMGLVR